MGEKTHDTGLLPQPIDRRPYTHYPRPLRRLHLHLTQQKRPLQHHGLTSYCTNLHGPRGRLASLAYGPQHLYRRRRIQAAGRSYSKIPTRRNHNSRHSQGNRRGDSQSHPQSNTQSTTRHFTRRQQTTPQSQTTPTPTTGHNTTTTTNQRRHSTATTHSIRQRPMELGKKQKKENKKNRGRKNKKDKGMRKDTSSSSDPQRRPQQAQRLPQAKTKQLKTSSPTLCDLWQGHHPGQKAHQARSTTADQ